MMCAYVKMTEYFPTFWMSPFWTRTKALQISSSKMWCKMIFLFNVVLKSVGKSRQSGALLETRLEFCTNLVMMASTITLHLSPTGAILLRYGVRECGTQETEPDHWYLHYYLQLFTMKKMMIHSLWTMDHEHIF